MTVSNGYDGTTPVVNASASTWGGILNTALSQIKSTLDAFVTAINAFYTDDIVLADVAPTSIRSVGFRGAPVVSIDADRTFGATDAGKTIRLIGVTGRTWTIPPATFPIGTQIVLRSVSTGSISVARGSGVELRLAGSTTNANRSIASYGMAVLSCEDLNVWVISGVGVS